VLELDSPPVLTFLLLKQGFLFPKKPLAWSVEQEFESPDVGNEKNNMNHCDMVCKAKQLGIFVNVMFECFFAEAERKNPWLASSASKRWGEAFFLLYSPFWIIILLGVVVPLKLYEVQVASYSFFILCCAHLY